MLDFLNSNTMNFSSLVDRLINRYDTSMLIELQLFVHDRVVAMDPDQLVSIVMTEDYTNSHRGSMTMELSLTPEQATLLYKSYKNLKAYVACRMAASGTSTPVFANTYVVLFKEFVDVEQLVSGKSAGTVDNADKAEKLTVELELIPDRLYLLKRKKLNCILHNVTMYDTLMAVATMFDYSEVNIAAPDNDKVYRNMIIPALSSIDDVFDFLQSSPNYHGVYSSGLGYFCYAKTLYVYPRFASLSTSRRANFFNASASGHDNARSSHISDKEQINIAITSKVDVTDNTMRVVENLATSYSIENPDTLIDGITDDSNGEVAVIADNMEVIGVQHESFGATSAAFNQTHIKTRNMLDRQSLLHSNITYQVVFEWNGAIPFILNPAMQATYLTDGDTGMTHTQGIISSVEYIFRRTTTADTRDSFVCSSQITLLLNKL